MCAVCSVAQYNPLHTHVTTCAQCALSRSTIRSTLTPVCVVSVPLLPSRCTAHFITSDFCLHKYSLVSTLTIVGRDSSVGIATGYGLDGPGIESWWRRDISHTSRPTVGPIQSSVQWVPGLSGVKRLGRGLDHPPHPTPRLKKGYSYISTSPLGPGSLFYGKLYFTLAFALR
jgi:hypothetical protein